MKKTIALIIIFFYGLSFGQSLQINKNSDLYKNAPEWAKLMYSENPNVNKVDELYEKFFKKNRYRKTYHTQFYKRWRRGVNPYLDSKGKIDIPKKSEIKKIINDSINQPYNKNTSSGNWTSIGPFRDFKIGGVLPSGGQANIYTIGRCEAFPNVMYCGTESGEVYKSIDGANTWSCASTSLVTGYSDYVIANMGIFALAVHPSNPDIVYIGSSNIVYKTTNGGLIWSPVLFTTPQQNGHYENPAEILIHPSNPEIVFVAGKEGIFRTSNGGLNWNIVHSNESYDIKANTATPNILYTVSKNLITNTHQFLTSTDAGLTWSPQTIGWYTSTNPARTVEGARIAVTAADSNRIYAYLIGDSKPGDLGCIGLYKSNDGGITWVNTKGYDGAPFSLPNYPNLAASGPVIDSDSFHSGFYNCAIMASNTNPDEIAVGGIGMWRSTNGGQSFECVHNYGCGTFEGMHVDMQDFRALGNEHWATSDGGICKSTNMFATQPEFKMKGIRAADFWGFGSGWNRDILIGGTFHNGQNAYAEGFPIGDFLDIDGGEPASGYVSPGNESRVYSNGMGSAYLPQTITGEVLSAPFESSINESSWFADSSELEFHPSCYNIIYKGYENKLFKSTDGGASFSLVYTESNIETRILGIEISRTNTNKMYIVISPYNGSSYIKKTTNDWATSTTITLPELNNNLSIISLDPEDDELIWMAYPRGSNGKKVYKSLDGGITWINQTTTILNNQNIQAFTTVGGTNGGIYIATNKTCYYKNNSMLNWTISNNGLPSSISTRGIRPFYRDGKIRIASAGKGIWESPLYETPSRPVAKIMVDKLVTNFTCDNVFKFDDYSMLNHAGATWAWTFQNANITTSSIRNPQVTFNTSGNHIVTLTVTNSNGVSDTDTLVVTTLNTNTNTTINQNFEVQFLPQGWYQGSTGNFNWSYNNIVGGFGQSTNCMYVNNHIINEQGLYTDMIIPVNMTNVTSNNAFLTFDVAYAPYSINNVDALQVLVTTNCGETSSTVYNKAGIDLATAQQTLNPFIPSDSQWRKETINLSTYIGNSNVFIKFRNINGFGNALYVDNINLGEQQLKTAEFNLNTPIVYPNPLISSGFINVKSNVSSDIKFNLFKIDGKLIDTIFTKFNTPISIEKYNLSKGTYLYKIISNDKILTGKLIIVNDR